MLQRMFGSRNLTAKANSAKPELVRQNRARNLTARASGASLAANISAASPAAAPAPKYSKIQLKSNNVRNWTGFLTGAQPIHRAILKNQPKVLKSLLANPKVNPNNRFEGGQGSTPLMMAAEMGRKEIVDILLSDPRVDPTLRQQAMFGTGKSAAELATENRYTEIAAAIEAAVTARGASAGGRRKRRGTKKGHKSSRRTRRR